ncbi:hypothetical protein [Methanolobus profundi]|uniref:COMM domain-containing protein n=1 Tax=Methanolobus profundi TaxID=487685 RepID=A0A1I4UP08_9EURY|nr:hypothetical protein [Methanolobus profundi]SFM90645.1 hypothetical protein SAMN04488696_2815 [Methanolobus profundi]
MSDKDIVSLKLFGSREPPSFRSELDLFLKQDEKVLNDMISRASPSIEKDPAKIVDELSEEYQISDRDINYILRVATYFYVNLYNETINCDELRVYIDSNDAYTKVMNIYDSCGKKYAQNLDEYKDEMNSIYSVVPSLAGISWNTNLRSVVTEEGDFKKFVPVVQINMFSKKDEDGQERENNFTFQMSYQELCEFIRNIERVKSDLEVVKSKIDQGNLNA